MKNRLIVLGAGGSGKDYLKRILIDQYGYKPAVSCTTRPPRKNEVDGVDYHFVTEDAFKEMIDKGQFKEYNCFGANKWYYGTRTSDFECATVFIMTPSGIAKLTESERNEFCVVFLDIPESVRRERLSARNDADDTERRLDTDRVDFAGFKNYDLKVTVPDFDPKDIAECVLLLDPNHVVFPVENKNTIVMD